MSKNGVRKSETIDLHVLLLVILLLPIGVLWLKPVWAMALWALVPQGRIVTRMLDLRAFRRPVLPYWVVNELVVLLPIGLYAGWLLSR